MLKFTGTKLTRLEGRNSKLSSRFSIRTTMKNYRHSVNRFVVCINNKGYEASLQIGKLYRVITDENAVEYGLLRVIDEEGEDYGYPTERFFPVEIPQALARVLQTAKRSAR